MRLRVWRRASARAWYAVLVIALMLGVASYAGTASVKTTEAQPYVVLGQDAGPVLELQIDIPMLEVEDPPPRVRVFADGRVRVHYPEYMTAKGEYELKLSPAELDALVLEAIGAGLVDYDEAEVKAAVKSVREMEKNSGSGPELETIHDGGVTGIRLKLAAYAPPGSPRESAAPVDKTVRWNNLRMEAKRYSGVKTLRRLAQLEESLLALAQHPALQETRRVED